MTLTRVTAGVPTGGQFAATTHAEPDLSLAAPDMVNAEVIERAVERMIGGAINHAHVGTPGDGDNQTDYHDGLAQAELRTAAEVLTLGDAESTTRVYDAMHQALTRSRASTVHPNTPENRAAIAHAATGCGASPRAVSREALGELIDRHVDFAVLAHAESRPDLDTSVKTPVQWTQIGLRNGYAHGIDALLHPEHENGSNDASERLLTALGPDDVTDTDELRRIARGHLARSDWGDWYDPYDEAY